MASFLTEAQRAALDAALAERVAASGRAGGKSVSHAPTSGPHAGDKKPKNLKGSGAAKKGGSGGKFTWGSMMEGEDGVSALDRNDPNYDSEEERSVLRASNPAHTRLQAEVAAYKQEISALVEEYFASGDVIAAAESLSDAGCPSSMGHYFVKRLITMALDRRDREREMASALLSSLYGEVLPSEQLAKGFARLVESLDDLRLDVPDAVECLALFIARGVVDDVLPPACVSRWAANAPDGSSLAALRARCEQHLGARHAAERLLRCWGNAGAGVSYAETKERISKLLSEYLASHDGAEASRCLRGLGVSFFHHELVKQALLSALEAPAHTEPVLDLLRRLNSSGEVYSSQLSKGFQRVAAGLADTALDNPAAPERFARLLDAAGTANLLEPEVLAGLAADTGRKTNGAALHANGGGSGGGANALAQLGASPGTAGSLLGGAGVPAFKLAMGAALREFFNSADADEVAARLSEAGQPGLHPLFVKLMVALAMDRRDREREMASSLLATLHPAVLSDGAVASGFTRLLAAADDLVLDIPDAVHLLSLFLGRAIVDEVLPPAFLASCLPSLPDGSLGITVVQATGAMLSQRHAAERLTACWHGGGLSLEDVRRRLRDALQEYMLAGSTSEVAAVLSELDLPHYHHELVKGAVEEVFAHPEAAPSLAGLLRNLSETGVVSSTQMAQGLKRINDQMADEELDAPRARAAFAQLLEQARTEGWLPPEFTATAN